MLCVHQPGLKILEALAASGLRSIRYAREIPRVGTIVANDLSKDAYHSMCENIEHNQVGDKVLPSWREARYITHLQMKYPPKNSTVLRRLGGGGTDFFHPMWDGVVVYYMHILFSWSLTCISTAVC